MKKLLLLLTFSLAIVVIAEETDFHIFTTDYFEKYYITGDHSQNWPDARMITLKVQGGTTVYITNYIDDWNDDNPERIALGDVDYAEGYDMSANKYGYVFAEHPIGPDGEPIPTEIKPDGIFHPGNGNMTTITYKNPNGPETRQTTGYLLGTFKEDAEIFFVMTPNGYTDTINSYDPVNEYNYDTDPETNDPNYDPAIYGNPVKSILQSRHVNPRDQVDNARVNFGTVNGVGHEFVVGYEVTPPVGSPLPSVWLSGLIFLGTATAARLRKRSRK